MSLTVDIKKDLGGFKLDVQFDTGGIMGILGPSGSGKSMTLKCIAGVERPDEGHIELNGVTLFDSRRGIDLKPQRRQVGYLFQNYALFPNMTVERNILCGLNREKDKAKGREICRRYIKLMGLEGLENSYPHQLSGGQQQRAALARILVGSPRLILLDEPFAALDSHLRDRLLMETKGILDDFDGPVIAVTHNRDEAYDLCGTIGIMDGGSMLDHRDTKALFRDPGSVAAAYITGCKNIAPAQKAGEYRLYVPDWGITLDAAKPVSDNVKAVGIRAHSFGEVSENSYPVEVLGIAEGPFEDTLRFRYKGQSGASDDLWQRIPHSLRPPVPPDGMGVRAEDVLALE